MHIKYGFLTFEKTSQARLISVTLTVKVSPYPVHALQINRSGKRLREESIHSAKRELRRATSVVHAKCKRAGNTVYYANCFSNTSIPGVILMCLHICSVKWQQVWQSVSIQISRRLVIRPAHRWLTSDEASFFSLHLLLAPSRPVRAFYTFHVCHSGPKESAASKQNIGHGSKVTSCLFR